MTDFNFLRNPLHPALEKMLTLRLPASWLPVTIAIAIVLLATTAATAIEAYRQNAADAMLRRAEARFENGRRALTRQRLQWNELDHLIAQDRRLRHLRLSGLVAASKIAALGNALPDRTWVTSILAIDGRVELKGAAEDLDALQSALERIDRSRTGDIGGLRFSADRHGTRGVSFQFRVGAVR